MFCPIKSMETSLLCIDRNECPQYNDLVILLSHDRRPHACIHAFCAPCIIRKISWCTMAVIAWRSPRSTGGTLCDAGGRMSSIKHGTCSGGCSCSCCKAALCACLRAGMAALCGGSYHAINTRICQVHLSSLLPLHAFPCRPPDSLGVDDSCSRYNRE